MSTEKFVVEMLPWKKKGRPPKEVPWPLPKPGSICWCLLARSESGKTTLMCNLVRAYQKQYERIIILSPSIMLDKSWDNIRHYPNVVGGDEVTNAVLQEIKDIQFQVYDHKKPDENRCLLLIDDSSNDLKRANLRYMFTKFTTMFRHWGGDLIYSAHNITFLEGAQINNTKQFAVWDMNNKYLKKFCDTVATAKMNEEDMYKYIRENTKEMYSFVFWDIKKPTLEETFWIGFDRPYLT